MKPTSTTLSVFCLGVACYDLTFAVERDPGLDEKIHANALVRCGGGMAANAAVTVARLGGQVGLMSYLGNDAFGDAHMEELIREGVHVDWIVRGEAATPLSVIYVKSYGQRSIVHYSPNDLPSLQPAPDLSSWRPKVILLDGHHVEVALPVAKWARNQGVPVVLDADSPGPGTESLLAHVDFIVASARFARRFTGVAEPRGAARLLNEYAPSVVITLGERGLVWSNREGAYYEAGTGQMPAFFVQAVDTTGAGDAFHGAFALGIAQKMGWHELLRFASAVAAMTCMRLGSRPAIPFHDQVELFLREHTYM